MKVILTHLICSYEYKLLTKIIFYPFTALKIHITAEMNDQLSTIGGFKTEHRGLIDVKVSILNLL